MPADGWIYGNARKSGKKADGFFVRRCDAGLEAYRQQMLALSKTLLEGMRRGTQEECWAAGYLDEERQVYVIAVAASQEELLEMDLHCQENRGFFCVMAYRLFEEDIQLYRRDNQMFEPLKEMMRQINEEKKGKYESWQSGQPVLAELGRYQLPVPLQTQPFCRKKVSDVYENDRESMKTSPENRKSVADSRTGVEMSLENGESRTGAKNILKSTEETDEAVWNMGLQRMVFTGVATEESAKRLLCQFPDGIVTVNRECVKEMRYLPQKNEESQKEERQADKEWEETIYRSEREQKEKQNGRDGKQEETKEEKGSGEIGKEGQQEQRQQTVQRKIGNGVGTIYLGWVIGGGFAFILFLLMLLQNG